MPAPDPKVKLCIDDDCTNVLRGRQTKFCSARCKNRTQWRKTHGAKTPVERFDGNYSDEKVRRGDIYQVLLDHPITQDIIAGEVTMGYAADQLGYSRTAVTRAIAAIVADMREDNATGSLSPQERLEYLGPELIDLPEAGTDEYEAFLDLMVAAFIAFRTEFFEAKRGVPFVNLPYHIKWIRATIHAILQGSQQQILSPPRHGKSELMVHFCVWLILRNPDIRIMWVAASDPLAKQMVGGVKDHLEYNEKLGEAFLGKGKNWKFPGRWSSLEITVNTRTIVGQKSYTMVGVGWRGTILSRDCDFIVLDDIEDDRSIDTPGARQKTREKFVITLDSRNEDHTAVLVIGSRQHHDDLYGYLIDNSQWNAIVEQAHDDECPQDLFDLTKHYDCMLWPDRHPYSWWFEKWQGQKEMGLEGTFEMVYQNRPRASGLIVFTKEQIQQAYNRERTIGDLSWFTGKNIPTHNQVAGADPAAVGQQAYWNWLYDPKGHKAYMLDAKIDVGGGLQKLAAVLIEWKMAYDLTMWDVEKNNVQMVFIDDERIREICGELGILIEPMQTGANKHSTEFGLPGMARWLDELMIDLPYGDDHSQQIVDIWTRQAIGYEVDDAGKASQRGKNDLLMASWFPFRHLLQWSYEEQASVELEYEPTYAGYAMSTVSDGMPW